MKELVEISIKEGATVACGGKVAEVPGFEDGKYGFEQYLKRKPSTSTTINKTENERR